MIAGIGIDLVTISRIKRVHEKFGIRFARRILSESEMIEYDTRPKQVEFLAKRFAVKEASVKALGTGERRGVLLRDFYVVHDELGKPHLRVDGVARQICDSLGINSTHVSLTDERDQVVAFVILEKLASPMVNSTDAN